MIEAQLAEVHLLQLPVQLAARARQHFEGLMREFALISAGNQGAHPDHHVPGRLIELVDALNAQYAGMNSAADDLLQDAIEAGRHVIEDQVLQLPPEAAGASRALGDLVDEADEYCRRGQHLLTLASPPDCVAYRSWYLGQVVGQLEGAAPVAWPDSEQARGL